MVIHKGDKGEPHCWCYSWIL